VLGVRLRLALLRDLPDRPHDEAEKAHDDSREHGYDDAQYPEACARAYVSERRGRYRKQRSEHCEPCRRHKPGPVP
jgi:hypothetical protein